MKRYVKPAQNEVATPEEDPISADINLDELYDKTKLILYREIRNLLRDSASQLLSKDSSQSLVNYAKLLKDLRKEERERLKNLTDEELAKIKDESEQQESS